MTDNHDKQKEDLAGYALGALDEIERAQVETHLGVCSECPHLLMEYQEILGLLPYSLPFVALPPVARTTLLAQVWASHAPQPAPTSSSHVLQPQPFQPRPTIPQPEPAPRFRGRLLQVVQPLRWIAVGALLVVLLIWNIQLQRWNAQLERRLASLERSVNTEYLASLPTGRIIALQGSGTPNATARLYVSADGQRGELAITGLPPLPVGRTYRLWFARPDQPTMTGGAFQVDVFGGVLAPVKIPVPLEEVSNIAVTEEPVTDAPEETLRPTGEHLLDKQP